MALTQQTLVDIDGGTQTITFSNPSQVDQISYSGGTITFESISSYDLVKSDLLLYAQYFQTYLNLLLNNFPALAAQVNNILPLSNFQISETSSGVTHITYNQTSQGSTVININYVPTAGSSGMTARASPVTITIQEFNLFILCLYQYANQIRLN